MNLLKTTIVLAFSAILMGSCRTTYIKKFYKDANRSKICEANSVVMRLKADTLRVIYPELTMFDFGKDEIKPAAKVSLQQLSTLLKDYDRISFVINGYTDNVGGADVNQSLSERRAQNAKSLFQANGVNADRMQTNGRGADNPIMSNTTEDGRQANRRVELLLYERKLKSITELR